MNNPATFGSVISAKRKQLSKSQKELAQQLEISPQYLNDIERDRRSPSSDAIVGSFADALDLPVAYLYYLAGKFPEDVRSADASPEKVQEAMIAFRKVLLG